MARTCRRTVRRIRGDWWRASAHWGQRLRLLTTASECELSPGHRDRLRARVGQRQARASAMVARAGDQPDNAPSRPRRYELLLGSAIGVLGGPWTNGPLPRPSVGSRQFAQQCVEAEVDALMNTNAGHGRALRDRTGSVKVWRTIRLAYSMTMVNPKLLQPQTQRLTDLVVPRVRCGATCPCPTMRRKVGISCRTWRT